MKKILSAVIIFCVMIFSVTCQAFCFDIGDSDSVSVTTLETLIGNWYDSKGNLTLTISNDYKLNGCAIMNVGMTNVEYEIGYKIIYRDGNRDKSITLWHPHPYSTEHEILFMKSDNKNWYALRKTKNPQYFESIGGIYLGMDKDEVLKFYGEPSKKDNSKYYSVWTYKKQGFDLFIEGNIVTCIKIYPYGDRKFDRSGLSARNFKKDFEYKYNLKNDFNGFGFFAIGYGEYIKFKDDKSVVLTLMINSIFDIL